MDFIDIQVLLLVHMEKCQRKIDKNTGEIMVCPMADCEEMRNIKKHTIECEAKESCMEPHCSVALQIISHWRNCSRMNCEVCLFLPICPTKFLEPEIDDRDSKADNSESSGDWRQSVSKIMRVHLVQYTALEVTNFNLSGSKRLHHYALTLAKVYEALSYKKATSRDKYFDLINRRTNQINTEINKIRIKMIKKRSRQAATPVEQKKKSGSSCKKIDKVRRRMAEKTSQQAAIPVEQRKGSTGANTRQVSKFPFLSLKMISEPATPELLEAVEKLIIDEILKLVRIKDDSTVVPPNSELPEFFNDSEIDETEKPEYEIMVEALRQDGNGVLS